MPRSKGFTLIEALIVIFMIAITSTFAVPGIMKWRSSAKLRGTAENLKGNLELAKLKAIQANGPVAINFSEKSYLIFLDTGPSKGLLDKDELILKKISLPAGIKIDFAQTTFNDVANNWPKKTRFMGRGTADAGTAVLVNSNGKKHITISTFGKITIKNPS